MVFGFVRLAILGGLEVDMVSGRVDWSGLSSSARSPNDFEHGVVIELGGRFFWV